MNSCTFCGRLTADPQLVGEGKNLRLSFTLAVDRDRKDAEGNRVTDFLDFVCWRGTAEFVAQHFHKGDSMIVVNAREEIREYTSTSGEKKRKNEHVISSATSIYFGNRRRADQENGFNGTYSGEEDFVE